LCYGRKIQSHGREKGGKQRFFLERFSVAWLRNGKTTMSIAFLVICIGRLATKTGQLRFDLVISLSHVLYTTWILTKTVTVSNESEATIELATKVEQIVCFFAAPTLTLQVRLVHIVRVGEGYRNARRRGNNHGILRLPPSTQANILVAPAARSFSGMYASQRDGGNQWHCKLDYIEGLPVS
jgi:hypothetical protein